MKRKVIIRGFLGFPLGVFIGYTITIVTSLIWGNGYYSPVVPDLVEACKNEINAVALQFVLSGILGAACAAGSAIWENENWSVFKQTILHFLLLSFSMLPIAYFTHWMVHSLMGVLSYFAIFAALYVIIWVIQYLTWKHNIQKINDEIRKDKKDSQL